MVDVLTALVPAERAHRSEVRVYRDRLFAIPANRVSPEIEGLFLAMRDSAARSQAGGGPEAELTTMCRVQPRSRPAFVARVQDGVSPSPRRQRG
jgi:hypothetical protein